MRMRLLVSGLSKWKEMSFDRLTAPNSATGQDTSDSRRLPCQIGRADSRASPVSLAALRCVEALCFLAFAFFFAAMVENPGRPEEKRPGTGNVSQGPGGLFGEEFLDIIHENAEPVV